MQYLESRVIQGRIGIITLHNWFNNSTSDYSNWVPT